MKTIAMALGSCVAVSLASVGCHHMAPLHVVERTSYAGIVGIPTAQDAARSEAEDYMTHQCPSGYDITREGEAVIGQQTSAKTSTGGYSFWASQKTTQTTEDKTEWRIEYRCKGAPADAAPAAPSAEADKASSAIHTLVIRL